MKGGSRRRWSRPRRSAARGVEPPGKLVVAALVDEEDRNAWARATIVTTAVGRESWMRRSSCEPEQNELCTRGSAGRVGALSRAQGKMAHGAMPEAASTRSPRYGAVIDAVPAVERRIPPPLREESPISDRPR
jgi:hypothetical protein